MKMVLSETSGADKENRPEPRMDKLETWYFSTGFKLEESYEGATRDDWVKSLALFVRERNSSVQLAESV